MTRNRRRHTGGGHILKGRVILIYGSCQQFSHETGIPEWKLSAWITGRSMMTKEQAEKLVVLLKVSEISDLYPAGAKIRFLKVKPVKVKAAPKPIATIKKENGVKLRLGHEMLWLKKIIIDKFGSLDIFGEIIGGVPHATLSEIIRGVRGVTVVERYMISKALDIDPKMLEPGYVHPEPKVEPAPEAVVSVPDSDRAAAVALALEDHVRIQALLDGLDARISVLEDTASCLKRSAEILRKAASDILVERAAEPRCKCEEELTAEIAQAEAREEAQACAG